MSELIPEGLPLLQAVHFLLALVIIGSGLAVISRRNPVSAVACLVVHFVATASMYLLLNSQFVAAIQVLVYAGAILVLFLFVVMLLKVEAQPSPLADTGHGRKALVAGLVVTMLSCFGGVALHARMGLDLAPELVGAQEDTVAWVADALFTRHLVAFELASIILTAAMAGVMVYTTRRVVVGRRKAETVSAPTSGGAQ